MSTTATLLTDLIQAAEQAARDEVIAFLEKTFVPGEVRIVPSTRGALERVVRAAAEKAKEDAQADAIRRFGFIIRAQQQEIARLKAIARYHGHAEAA